MGINKEKSNIAVAILEILPFLKGTKKLFCILMLDGNNNIFADCDLTNYILTLLQSLHPSYKVASQII